MPERRRRRPAGRALVRLVAALLLTALAAAGCASIPTSGPVRSGATAGAGGLDSGSGYHVEPLGPTPGAAADDVVRGFYLAGVGVDDDFAAAREFLAPARRTSWRPTARTVVHALGSLTVSSPVSTGDGQVAVTVSTPVTGEVDASGGYAAAGPGTPLVVVLHLARTRGQWRITDAPDLLLLDDPDFERVFTQVPVYFPDRSGAVMVPDPRWVLDRSSTAATLVADLLAGPSAGLAPAVASAATAGGDLDPGSVVVADGTARVDLPQRFGDEPAASLRLLQQQFIATLSALPGVLTVAVSVDGGALPAVGTPRIAGQRTGGDLEAPSAASDDDEPFVLAGGRVARLSAGSPEPVAGLPDLSGTGASSPAGLAGQYAVLAGGRTQLLRLASGRATALLSGTDLTPPSVDSFGWTWSTSQLCGGAVTAVSRAGAVVEVPAGWLTGRRVVSLRVAPDGVRVAIASTGASGGDARVDVAALRRDGDGAPQRLTAAAADPTPWIADVEAVAWVGEGALAVLATPAAGSPQASGAAAAAASAPSVWLVTGGRPRAAGAPAGSAADAGRVTSLAAGDSRRSLLVVTADGRLWQLAGVDWAPLGIAASDPAYPG